VLDKEWTWTALIWCSYRRTIPQHTVSEVLHVQFAIATGGLGGYELYVL